MEPKRSVNKRRELIQWRSPISREGELNCSVCSFTACSRIYNKKREREEEDEMMGSNTNRRGASQVLNALMSKGNNKVECEPE